KAYNPLRRGALNIKWSTMHTAQEEDAGIFAFERDDGAHKVLVVINVSDGKMSDTAFGGGQMMTSFAANTQIVDVLAAAGDPTATFTVGIGGGMTVAVPARGARVLLPAADVVALP